ncbi:MAG: voltage-gated sodium channel, partial [Saprospiraceae bacterium]
MFRQFFLSERNMLLAILLNSIIIFLLYFPQIEHGE